MSESSNVTPSSGTPSSVSTNPPKEHGDAYQVGQNVYDATATFGRLWALLSAIFATIIGIVFVIAGIWILAGKQIGNRVPATVTMINGTSSGNPECGSVGNGQFGCQVTVHYMYKGRPHDVSVSYTGKVKYYVGQQVQVTVNPNNPDSVDLSDPVPKWVGGASIVMGLLVIGFSWGAYWLTGKSKVFAAAEGTGAFLNIATGGRL